MKRASLMSLVAVLLMAGQLTAADIRYQTSGDWFATVAVDGFGWQAPGLPGVNDNARFNWGGNTVTLAGAAPDVRSLQIGVDESGTLEVNNGGVISTTTSTGNGDVLAGNNNANATGTLTVNTGGIVNVGRILWAANNNSTGFININSGGVVNVASHLWWGVTGTATVNISGTLQQNGGILGLGTSNASTASGGSATVSILDGGLMALNNISGNPGLPSIQAGSSIDISGSGQLTLPGDFVGLLTDYANANKIGGNGVPGMSNLTIDLTKNPGFTTAYVAIPEPAALLLLGLSLGGILISKRR
ncbi:PEP-CTERM sorting domain-containing protein [Bythopirellula polymerisocia]|uniref:PEP-CTERM protein-sorting domain-containing protein n=1 Tax=Bythopirellula polymerisocia TaxID=2528003 RepID=A0A5C6CB35_9BACT|nr:PEP-CTERM sorting domain-containing protein [Bythopirellula polymerisocia]TWU21830.1 hypothetical protein Pla144_45260 [Bythopirellula polymerisocia]